MTQNRFAFSQILRWGPVFLVKATRCPVFSMGLGSKVGSGLYRAPWEIILPRVSNKELSIENVKIIASTYFSIDYLFNDIKPSFNTKGEYRSRALVIKF